MMKTRGSLALGLGAALVAGACGGWDDAGTREMRESMKIAETPPEAAPLQPGYERVFSGSLERVDPDSRTFTIRTNVGEQAFLFNEFTDVYGVPGAQGLAQQAGTKVIVHYREDAGSMIATRIILEDTVQSPAGQAPAGEFPDRR
jgi:hypothetical protein